MFTHKVALGHIYTNITIWNVLIMLIGFVTINNVECVGYVDWLSDRQQCEILILNRLAKCPSKRSNEMIISVFIFIYTNVYASV